ncbi:hypothetical protein KC852_00900 [Candidatus Nomurabacteria bacterium]|nr:hypothetical protein [Candidatus Nomurabacteria bacterium]
MKKLFPIFIFFVGLLSLTSCTDQPIILGGGVGVGVDQDGNVAVEGWVDIYIFPNENQTYPVYQGQNGNYDFFTQSTGQAPYFVIGFITSTPTNGDWVYVPEMNTYVKVANFTHQSYIYDFYQKTSNYYDLAGENYYPSLSQMLPVKLELNENGELAGKYSEVGIGY